MNREENKDNDIDECLKEKHIIRGENVLIAPLVFCKCKKCSIFKKESEKYLKKDTDTKWYILGSEGIFKFVK